MHAFVSVSPPKLITRAIASSKEFELKNEYKQRLDDIKKQINNLLNNIASGIAVEETNNKINELEKEKETIEEKLIESDQKEKDNKVSLNMIKL